MKFNPDKDFQKHRDAAGGVWLVQNGHRFSISGKHVGKVSADASKDDMPEEDDRKDIRNRAKKKVKDFAGNDKANSPIAKALEENRAVEAAEERA